MTLFLDVFFNTLEAVFMLALLLNQLIFATHTAYMSTVQHQPRLVSARITELMIAIREGFLQVRLISVALEVTSLQSTDAHALSITKVTSISSHYLMIRIEIILVKHYIVHIIPMTLDLVAHWLELSHILVHLGLGEGSILISKTC